jgi:crossover junction endodeoxyribonuclease RuvC
MAIVLGIDPGSRITGWGLISALGQKNTFIASGCIRMETSPLPERLKQIFDGVSEIIEIYHPQQAAIEQVFLAQNADSAFKLGQARGAAITAIVNKNIEVAEYSARQVKQAVVGKGAADKKQVQHMVCRILQLDSSPQADAADALAIAICHANTQHSLIKLVGAKKIRRGRLR